MKTILLVWSIAALAGLATPPIASAVPTPFEIDSTHSVVRFIIRHFFSRVEGQLKDFFGALRLDEQDFSRSSVDVTIQTASIFNAHEERDKDLRGPKFFAADTFPTITFRSTKVTLKGEKTYQVDGNLTMHGVTRPVTLDVTFLGIGEVSFGGGRYFARTVAGFEAQTTVNRKDFGITWNRVLDQGGTMLGDDVAISIQIEALHSDEPSPWEPSDRPAPTKK